ncbi:DUF2934 domain-containing protein [Pararobbsia alpina]|nr:DUF2934 domain-containing protein [Pararobbsia alpina]
MHSWNEEHIRLLAYELWLLEGCPEGRADEHWDRAIKMMADEDRKRGVGDLSVPLNMHHS